MSTWWFVGELIPLVIIAYWLDEQAIRIRELERKLVQLEPKEGK